MNILYVSDDIEIRPLNESHATELFGLINDNREYLREWLTWVDATTTEDDIRGNIIKAANNINDRVSIDLGIFFGNKLIGKIGTHQIVWETKRTKIGYWISQGYSGRGIVTQSVSAFLDYLFDQLGLNHITIRMQPENRGSRNIPLRLGFMREGLIRDEALVNGEYKDLEYFGIKAQEWHAHKKQVSETR